MNWLSKPGGATILRAMSSLPFTLHLTADGEATDLVVEERGGPRRTYRIAGGEQADYVAFYDDIARDYGTRPAHHVDHVLTDPVGPPWQPLLTDNATDRILYGYGDPAVLKTKEGYVLIATSNDAPDALPMLRSHDLVSWEPDGFAFPEGSNPDWTLAGLKVGDF